MIGRTLGRFRITEKLGEGGMGVVYRAFDTRLNRTVALKALPPAAVADPHRRERFVQEAIAASALNHPHIVTTYDIDTIEGVEVIAMEYVEGRSLDRVIAGGPIPVSQAVAYAAQIASALAAAHRAGIVHRDIKPANLLVTPGGQIKVVDFGLAKLIEPEPAAQDAATAEARRQTTVGTVVGTVAYMSPEQAEGRTVTPAADVFALGVVIYEMLTGSRPFRGDSAIAVLAAALHHEPAPVASLRPEVPATLDGIVTKCLQKIPAARYASGVELSDALAALTEATARPDIRRRPTLVVGGAAAIVIAVIAAAGWWALGARQREAARMRLAEVEQLVAAQRSVQALRTFTGIQRVLGDDPDVQALAPQFLTPGAPIVTEPPGARVELQDYLDPNGPWEAVGETPLSRPLPIALVRLRVSRPGYLPRVVAHSPDRVDPLLLLPDGAQPAGMVHVSAGTAQYGTSPSKALGAYWIDQHEVSHADFKRFVDAGGYRRREFWKHAFVDGGTPVSWDRAMAVFVDTTGRPGPATWEVGTFPDGKGNDPVSGVSWYEAAAYAEFAGKQLPSIYHWYRAAGLKADALFSDVLQTSNFGGRGPLPAGTDRGLGPFGTFDMAGNVKEWCFNEANDGRRFILGGAWSDPVYMFSDVDAQSPMDRQSGFGMRLIKPVDAAADLGAGGAFEPFHYARRDVNRETRPDEATFDAYRRLYAYDRVPLDARTERSEEAPWWRKETISFAAAYNGERVPAYLFLPLNADPPYDAVVHLPGAYAAEFTSSADLSIGVPYFDFIVRSGRAVLFPVVKGTYERQYTPSGPNARRDLTVQWTKDLARSLDYLESRPDIARGEFALVGLSMGANEAPIYSAIEPRFKAVVAMASGLNVRPRLAEVEAANFAPRVRAPFLMINGRQDFMRPYESSQLALFTLLGVPEPHKRLASYEGGHLPPRAVMIKETLAWLDRYLGPVETR